MEDREAADRWRCVGLARDGCAADECGIVADGNLTQTNSLLSIAVGGARVQVPVPYVAEAIAVMAALRSGAFALRENEDLGPADQ